MESEVIQIDILGGVDVGRNSSAFAEIRDRENIRRFIMVDCGAGIPEKGEGSIPIPLRPRSNPDLCVITHAHTDHILMAPRYFTDYNCDFMMTGPTYFTSEYIFGDHLRHSLAPIFSIEEMHQFIMSDKTKIFYSEDWIEVFPGAKIKFKRNGHIRGSAMVFLKTDRHKVAFSGDVSSFDTPTISGVDVDGLDFNPDILFLESTNGSIRLPERESEIERMTDIAKKFRLALIPSFGVGKSPDLALDLARQNFPVHLDGKGKKVLLAYTGEEFYWCDGDRGIERSALKKIKFVKGRKDRELLVHDPFPKAVVTTGGMMNGLALDYIKHWGTRDDAVIFKTGYAAEDTPGYGLMKSVESGMPFEISDGVSVKIEAHVEEINISGHNDGPQNVALAKAFNPKKIFVGHGEVSSRKALTKMLIENGLCAEALEKDGQVIIPD